MILTVLTPMKHHFIANANGVFPDHPSLVSTDSPPTRPTMMFRLSLIKWSETGCACRDSHSVTVQGIVGLVRVSVNVRWFNLLVNVGCPQC